jgi:hypothetical protein
MQQYECGRGEEKERTGTGSRRPSRRWGRQGRKEKSHRRFSYCTRTPAAGAPHQRRDGHWGRWYAGNWLTRKQPTEVDIAAYAEVHCRNDDDEQRWAKQIWPTGRSFFTFYLAIFIGPRLDGVEFTVTSYANGRVMRLDCRLHGRNRSYIFVYVPDKREERRPFLAGFQACMPAARDVVIIGPWHMFNMCHGPWVGRTL